MFSMFLFVVFTTIMMYHSNMIDMTTSLQIGEQLSFDICNTFTLFTIRKEKIIENNALIKYIMSNDNTSLQCYPNEEYVYKNMEKLISSVETSIQGIH
jgi:hypothetical protein